MSIEQTIRDMKNPTAKWEDKLRQLVAEFQEIKREIRLELLNAIDDVKKDSLFSDLEPAKKLAERVAKQEIASFKQDVQEKVQSVLDTTETNRQRVFEKIESELTDKIGVFENQLTQVISELQTQIRSANEQNIAEIDGVRKSIESMRGPQGERGANGTNGKDADPTVVADIVVARIPKIEELSADNVVEKINKAKDKVLMQQVAGLSQTIQELRQAIRTTGRDRVGGGGDVVIAGTGVTITRTSDGKQEIAASGITADAVKTETPTGDINGVNTTYTTTATINAIFSFSINGQFLHPTTDYTVAGSTITMTAPLPSELSGKPFTLIYI